eukprot:scaffold3990_cov284-Chaetoceros_neogracile.AAC.15
MCRHRNYFALLRPDTYYIARSVCGNRSHGTTTVCGRRRQEEIAISASFNGHSCSRTPKMAYS